MADNPSQAVLMQEKYIEFFELPVEKKSILIEALQGKNFGYSCQMLAKVLRNRPEFSDYTVHVVCTPENVEERKDFFKWIGAPGIQPVLYATEEYNRLLATAGVLINENSFQNHFIKKEDQIYIRIWNGIPMKRGGRYADNDYASIGNMQRNLLCADYLVCPNEFTLHCLADNYMLANLGQTKVLYAGKFQNEILFDKAAGEELRVKYGMENKEILLYVPTIRGAAGSPERQEKEEALWNCLQKLDTQLKEEQLLYISVPYRMREDFDFNSLKHIAVAPRGVSLLRILAVAKCFVTDCSDLVFDFAATRKKIILFSFDHTEEAMKQYYSFHQQLPFAGAYSAEDVIREINTEKEYEDISFFETYSKYNKPGMAEAVLRRTILKECVPELMETSLPDNGKQNVIIYPGPLFKNGITSAVLSLLDHLDREKNNYILFFRTEHVMQVAETLKALPEGIAYYGYSNVRGVSEEEREIYDSWQGDITYPHEQAKQVLYKRTKLERQRLLSFCRVDTVIHYEGYGRDLLMLFEQMPCRRIVYLHNNMLLEVEKKDIRPEILCSAYSTYDVVALVSEEQRPVAEKMAFMYGGSGLKKCVLAKNVILYEQVVSHCKEAFVPDPQTEMNMAEEELRGLLASGKKKFITIGRFLPEKGHERLIHAFEQVHQEHPDTCLVILGGYGYLYEDTVQWAAKSAASEDIAVIKYLSNPYALLAACDYFVLSSFYEGFGLVLAEADIVGLPCVSTDIPGPSGFLGQYGGLLVEDSEDGIVEGMLRCLAGTVPKRLQIDYPEYNKEAIAQFEAMLSER